MFPAVMAVLDEPPAFIYHQCYCLVRDHSFKQFCWSIMGNGREDSGVRDSGDRDFVGSDGYGDVSGNGGGGGRGGGSGYGGVVEGQ